MDGTSWRVLEDDPGIGTFVRNMRRRDVHPESLIAKEKLLEYFNKQNSNSSIKVLINALEGDEKSIKIIEKMGEWESFTMGVEATGKLSIFQQQYKELEPHCHEADIQLKSENYSEVSKLIRDSSILNKYWKNDYLEKLSKSKNLDETLSPRISAWLELQISIISKYSTTNKYALEYQKISSDFDQLISRINNKPIKPGAQWIRCVQKISGEKTLSNLLQMAIGKTDSENLPSEINFKRWCNGSLFPSEINAEEFIIRITNSISNKSNNFTKPTPIQLALWSQYLIAKRLSFVLDFANSLINSEKIERHLTPSNASEWMQTSFDYWKNYWHKSGGPISIN